MWTSSSDIENVSLMCHIMWTSNVWLWKYKEMAFLFLFLIQWTLSSTNSSYAGKFTQKVMSFKKKKTQWNSTSTNRVQVTRYINQVSPTWFVLGFFFSRAGRNTRNTQKQQTTKNRANNRNKGNRAQHSHIHFFFTKWNRLVRDKQSTVALKKMHNATLIQQGQWVENSLITIHRIENSLITSTL